jgi:hypothetical protein
MTRIDPQTFARRMWHLLQEADTPEDADLVLAKLIEIWLGSLGFRDGLAGANNLLDALHRERTAFIKRHLKAAGTIEVTREDIENGRWPQLSPRPVQPSPDIDDPAAYLFEDEGHLRDWVEHGLDWMKEYGPSRRIDEEPPFKAAPGPPRELPLTLAEDGSHLRGWATQLVATIERATSLAAVDAWVSANQHHLDALAKEAPEMTTRLRAAIERPRAALAGQKPPASPRKFTLINGDGDGEPPAHAGCVKGKH